MNSIPFRTVLGPILLVFLGTALLPLRAQTDAPRADDRTQDVQHLRAEQDEILRKAVRMKELMERLEQRYQREGKKEQVALLQKGLEHLQHAALMQDVASIRDDLTSGALSDAVRKQKEVIDDLERLLNILLQRNSVENLDETIKAAAEMAADARELERRQAELQQRTQTAGERSANPAEQQLSEQLQQLARDQRAEAQTNARAAGSRRPFLESALQRVQQLLRQQGAVEQQAERQRTGAAAADREREREFELGELAQRTRELLARTRDQVTTQQLQQETEALQNAARGDDAAAVQQQKDRLQAELQRPPKVTGEEGPKTDPKWQEFKQQLDGTPAGATPAERSELQKLAAQGAELSKQRSGEQQQSNGAAAERLANDTEEAAKKLLAQQGTPDAPDSPAAAVRSAAQHVQSAAQSSRKGDGKQALEQLQQAQRDLDQARARQREQHPDAAQSTGQMAAEADAVAKDLRNEPSPGAEEPKAAQALDQAEQSLRQAEQRLGSDAAAPPDARPELQQAREALQQARDTLQQALGESNGGDRQAELQRAGERQQQLRDRTQSLQKQLQDNPGQQQGGLNDKQAKAAGEQVKQAADAMQKAQQELQQGQQASASSQQQAAADALQKAQQALQKNREPSDEQKKAVQALADEEKKLEEDILKLAEETKQKKNAAAQRALDEAADAARKAQRAMQQGDQDETEQQQERAREKLDEAAKQLEEERDRYQDLRQEELLFRMKEELTAFLDKQKPITAGTVEVQKGADRDGLSRPARIRLNRFGEEEQELSGRVRALVQALADEGNLVWQAVLKANHEDLTEVSRRLGGRSPDPGSYTTMLQQDVERRTQELLTALEREQKRREQQRQEEQKQQQQQQGQNRFNPQKKKLVSLIAELELLKTLESDTRRATDELQTLMSLRNGDDIGTAEVALVERLAARHSEVTKMFQQIKSGLEEALKAMQGQDDQQGNDQGGSGRRR